MSTIADTNKIDLVTKASDGEIILIMVEVRPWNEVSLTEVQNKFNTYLDFVEGGHLVEQYPEAQGSKLIFRLDTVNQPSKEVSELLDVVQKRWLSPMNIIFEIGELVIE